MDKKPLPHASQPSFSWFWVVLGMAFLVAILFGPRVNVREIPYSQFLTYLDQGKVSEVKASPDEMMITVNEVPQKIPKQYLAIPMEEPTALTRRLARAHVKF